MSRHERFSRSQENVFQHDSSGNEPRQDRIEESNGRPNFQTFLRNSVHTSCLWNNLPQWRRLDEENNLTSLVHNSQWIYRNFSLNDKRRGYPRRQDTKVMMVKIETLLDTRPDEVPTESKFLLEFDHGTLAQSNMHDQTY